MEIAMEMTMAQPVVVIVVAEGEKLVTDEENAKFEPGEEKKRDVKEDVVKEGALKNAALNVDVENNGAGAHYV